MPELFSKNRSFVISRLMLVVLMLCVSSAVFPAGPDEETTTPLTVALAECPPFVIFENGQYSGLAVFLWEKVGNELGLSWNYAEYSLGSLLETITDPDHTRPPDVACPVLP